MLNSMTNTLNIKSSKIFSLFFVFFAAFLSTISILLFDSIVIHIISIWIVVLISVFISKFDITHPYFWFSIIFTLYNTAHSILFLTGIDSSKGAGYTSINTLYSLYALVIVLFIVGPSRVNINKFPIYKFNINLKTTEILIYLFLFFLLFSSINLSQRGFSGKNEFLEIDDLIFSLSVNLIRWTFFLMSILLINYLNDSPLRIPLNLEKDKDFHSNTLIFKYKAIKNNNNFKSFLLIFFVGFISFLLTIFTGDRDIIFRFTILIIFILSFFKILKKYHFLIFAPILPFYFVYSVYFKYFFLDGSINTRLNDLNIFQQFLSSDFAGSGGNFQWLLNNNWTKGFFGIELFFRQIIQVFIPSLGTNLSYWFNYTVYEGTFKNRAFTLLGNGYVMGGFFGITILFIFIGITIKYFYKNSINNIYTLTLYFLVSIIIMGSFRHTLNGLFESFLRGIFLIYLFHYFIIRKIKTI